MKRIKKDEAGFTLVEMLIVIIIISTLLLIAVPNMSKSNEVVGKKSCDVTIKLLQSQVAAYEIEKGTLPLDLNTLVTEEYIDSDTCPSGQELELTAEGKVQVVSVEQTP
jgi:competence protein ComGC